jgi:hypothetical protein
VSVSKNKLTSFHLGLALHMVFCSLCALLSTDVCIHGDCIWW